jgi:hypothetical protein
MKNSWGQEIKVGDVVYRGARQGNSSEYKAGVVESLKTGKPPRIKWLFESYTMWVRIDGELVSVPYAYKMKKPSMGSPSLESLIVVDFDIEELERVADFFRNLNRDIEFMSLQEFEHARDSHQI